MNVIWQFQVAVPGGPSFTINQPNIEVSGYDVVAVTIPASTAALAVPVQPATASGDVILMIISSSKYDPGISYTVDALGATHVLDGPHVLVGSGAVSLLNSAGAPQKLTFKNTLASDINVQVMAGRKV